MHFWYDERNLPVQIGDNEYRYTAKPVLPVPIFGERKRRGQRYYKKVGTVEEYYIMDANLIAGVFSNKGYGFKHLIYCDY